MFSTMRYYECETVFHIENFVLSGTAQQVFEWGG